LVVLLVFGVVAAKNGGQPDKETADELEKKIQQLNDKIEELRKRQNELFREQKALLDKKNEAELRAAEEAARKEAERKANEEAQRKAKEAAEKKKHVAKVEIRGLLSKAPETFPFQANQFPQAIWTVTINDLKWGLKFGDKKDLVALATKLAGKPVTITGTVVNVRPQANPWLQQQLWPAQQPWPQPWPQPQPFPGQQQWQFFPVETPIFINVESIREAKD
jgi:hypothetical protein